MSENQRKFLETINKLMPRLTELEQEKLLAFGEGLAFMNGMSEHGQTAAADRPSAQDGMPPEDLAVERVDRAGAVNCLATYYKQLLKDGE